MKHFKPSWVIAVATAILISYILTSYIARDSLLGGCVRNGEFKNEVAVFTEQAVRARIADGDIKVANEYRKIANNIRDTIPAPDNYKGRRGTNAADREEGCSNAFPPPIPFVE